MDIEIIYILQLSIIYENISSVMAKMRATLRKAARVTPPPSPKNGGECIKGSSEWSSRLRNHSKGCEVKKSSEKSDHNRRIKKESTENHIIKSRSPSPVCVQSNGRRTRKTSEVSNYWGPRRSNRLIGIPAEADEDDKEEDEEDDDDEEGDAEDEKEEDSVCNLKEESREAVEAGDPQLCLPLKKRRISPLEENHISPDNNVDDEADQCKDCKKKKMRIDALLMESERFMQFPSRNSIRMRSTVNSRDSRTQIPESVDEVEFSFEIVPSGTAWFQTFLRDDSGIHLTDDSPAMDRPAPFLLPYEMSLESILKSNRGSGAAGAKRRSPKRNSNPSFRPIISTRLQMKCAAKQSKAAAELRLSELRAASTRHKRDGRRFNMPRKSPRCHASTMAILCSNSESETALEAVPEEEDEDDRCNMQRVLQQMLTQGVDHQRPASSSHRPRKRGRPRKHPLPVEQLPSTSLSELIATPLDRIEDIVDERIVGQQLDDLFSDDQFPLVEDIGQVPEAAAVVDPPELFHDLGAEGRSEVTSSSSVYETASDLGSTSTTGTCDSRRKGNWHRRRKRPNLTGWPRSKKPRKVTTPLFLDDDDVGDEEESDPEEAQVILGGLGTIHEESGSSKDSSGSGILVPVAVPVSPLQRRINGFSLNKPFSFQRKSLKFVGKRILRPAAQRHAPQRLEYWPCFNAELKRRKRKT